LWQALEAINKEIPIIICFLFLFVNKNKYFTFFKERVKTKHLFFQGTSKKLITCFFLHNIAIDLAGQTVSKKDHVSQD